MSKLLQGELRRLHIALRNEGKNQETIQCLLTAAKRLDEVKGLRDFMLRRLFEITSRVESLDVSDLG